MPPLRDRSWANSSSREQRSCRCRSRLCPALAFLAALFLSDPAFGSERPRVALVTSDPRGTTATRLEAELRSLGIQVMMVRVGPKVKVEGRALNRVAKASQAFAAVWLVSHGSKVEVWIADRVRGKTLAREVIAQENDPDNRDDTVAVGTVEVLRASLLAVSVEPEPRPTDPPATPSVRRLLRTPRRRQIVPAARNLFGVALGPAGDLGIGGVGPSLGAELGLRWQSTGAWGIEALFATTFRPATVRGQARIEPTQDSVETYPASADIFLHRSGLAITWSPLAGPWVPLVALGLTLVRFEARGRRSTDAQAIAGATDGTWAIAPYLGYGLGYDLGKNLRLRTAFGLLVAPRCTVRFVGDEVVRWGEPALMASLSFETLIPREQK